MIARSARLAGAVLIECSGQFFLVGRTKEPCNWESIGFTPPPEMLAGESPVAALSAVCSVQVTEPCLVFDWPGDAESLAQALAKRLLIQRNASVSERLWRLVTGDGDEESAPAYRELDATWLVRMPEPVWNIVRETVLRCL